MVGQLRRGTIGRLRGSRGRCRSGSGTRRDSGGDVHNHWRRRVHDAVRQRTTPSRPAIEHVFDLLFVSAWDDSPAADAASVRHRRSFRQSTRTVADRAGTVCEFMPPRLRVIFSCKWHGPEGRSGRVSGIRYGVEAREKKQSGGVAGVSESPGRGRHEPQLSGHHRRLRRGLAGCGRNATPTFEQEVSMKELTTKTAAHSSGADQGVMQYWLLSKK